MFPIIGHPEGPGGRRRPEVLLRRRKIIMVEDNKMMRLTRNVEGYSM
jgi:hypothetical protein